MSFHHCDRSLITVREGNIKPGGGETPGISKKKKKKKERGRRSEK